MEIKFLQVKYANGFAIIDAEDYEKVSGYEWEMQVGGKQGSRYYVGCRVGDKTTGQKSFRLAHVVLGLDSSEKRRQVKYLNKNTFDCRKSNLEFNLYGDDTVRQTGWTLNKYFNKTRKVCAWSVSVYFKHSQRDYKIGYYKTETAAAEVIKFIKEQGFSFSTDEEVAKHKPIVRQWALEKGFTNPPRSIGRKPDYKIGDEKTDDKGYIRIKTEKGWILKHHYVWKQAGKRLPKKHFLIFKDGNNRNFDVDNLEATSPEERGHRLALSQQPVEMRGGFEALWKIQKEIKDVLNKPTQYLKVTDSDKLVKVALEDYQKVSSYNWKLLNHQGKKVVGFRKTVGDRQYKIITLAHVIFDAQDEKIRVGFKNRNRFDYRRKNLNIVFFDRKNAIRPLSFYYTFVKNRKGAKSNWKVEVLVLNKRAALGYYLTEDSAKAVIEFAKKLTAPTDWDAFLQFREDVRSWAIENGHAIKSGVVIGRETRNEEGYRLVNRYLKCKRKWRVSLANRAVSKSEYHFGTFRTETIGKAIIEFIGQLGLPLSNRDEADKVKALVRAWADAKGYRNQPTEQQNSVLPNYPFNSTNTGEIICQTIQ